MGRDLFLVVLAALTAVCGIALLVMMARRRRASGRERLEANERVEDERPNEDPGEDLVDDEDASGEPRRLIDDYAIPVSFDGAQDDKDDELDISKICPRCGRRYGAHHRICERDNSELAALN